MHAQQMQRAFFCRLANGTRLFSNSLCNWFALISDTIQYTFRWRMLFDSMHLHQLDVRNWCSLSLIWAPHMRRFFVWCFVVAQLATLTRLVDQFAAHSIAINTVLERPLIDARCILVAHIKFGKWLTKSDANNFRPQNGNASMNGSQMLCCSAPCHWTHSLRTVRIEHNIESLIFRYFDIYRHLIGFRRRKINREKCLHW